MQTTITRQDQILIIRPQGRLDTFGSRELQTTVAGALSDDVYSLVMDLSAVEYISSAALRVLLLWHKQLKSRGGTLALAAASEYCRQVIEIAGLAGQLPMHATLDQALAAGAAAALQAALQARWNQMERVDLPCGKATVLPGGREPGVIHVLGHVQDVLKADVTAAHLSSKRFSETEYSIGLGGLGDRMDDYFGIMGEMITIGGTMVWLPTDGHDTPDFLIPKVDKGGVTIRTAYNVSIAGGFNEYLLFDSREPGGTKVGALYQDLFADARRRRPDFKGVLGLALRAQMGAVYGSGIRHSPVKSQAPANRKLVIDPENLAEWFELDKQPRHVNVTGLVVGVGADFGSDLSTYDKEFFGAVFYSNPGNAAAPSQMLHNHAVLFSELPMAPHPTSLEDEIRRVVDEGDFIDMRHLLDSSTITRALIGVSYIQEFRRDPAGQ